MPSENWIRHAYPLKLISVQVQGSRHSIMEDMANQLRDVAQLIDEGKLSGQSSDDDFGFRFVVDNGRSESIFPDRDQDSCAIEFPKAAGEVLSQSKEAFVFSVDSMSRCSGNAATDLPYAEYFCAEALGRSRKALASLNDMLDRLEWAADVQATCFALRGTIAAIHQTTDDFANFFSAKPAMASPFRSALPEMLGMRERANEVVEKILAWCCKA